MANITLLGASYTDVPAVTLPQTGGGTVTFYENGGGTPAISVVDTTDTHGGTIRTITALDISDTTAVASVVQSGYYFYTAQGQKTQGTASGGTPSATAHTIYFEFSDNTNTTITVYYDDSFISDAITATTPTTYGQKTVTLAQLDGVTWYNPAGIPLNTQLIDFNNAVRGYYIEETDGSLVQNGDACCSDFTPVDPTMTFTFIGYRWFGLAFYDSSKAYISGVMQGSYADTVDEYDMAHGTLSGSRIPSNAAYIRLSTYPVNADSSRLSLIRTA